MLAVLIPICFVCACVCLCVCVCACVRGVCARVWCVCMCVCASACICSGMGKILWENVLMIKVIFKIHICN